MIKRLIALLGLAMPLALHAQPASDAPFVRFPALNPEGTTISFSFQGDLWTVPVTGGRAIRLTVHEAYDAYPRWSPDGQHIAFTSDRYGHDDIFVIPSEGGIPQRITFHSAPDRIGDWTPRGSLLFTTRRAFAQVEREWEIHEVPATGGTPTRLLDALGYMPTMSPDGQFIAFARGSNREYRKGYRGWADKDIWLYRVRDGAYILVTTFQGNDMYPDWGDSRTLYYLSEADGTYNLYRLKLSDEGSIVEGPEQLTHFKGDGVRYFDVSANGKQIVFTRATSLYTMDSEQLNPQEVIVQIAADYRFDPVERRTFTRNADEFAVSPNGKLLAFVVRGEIFLTENDPESDRTVQITHHPYRDREVAWVNDTTLVFVSDRSGGQYDLYLVQSADPEEPDLFKTLKRNVIRLTRTKADERMPVLAPDGRHIAFRRDRGQLIVASLDTVRWQLGREKILLDGWATPQDIAWSPDSRYLAYALPDLDFNTEVYILPADGSQKPVNISQHPRRDFAPQWTSDGTKLVFLSARNNQDVDVWFAWLRREDWERTPKDWEELEKEDNWPKNKPVHIDFEQIHERLVQVTGLPGNESDLVVSPDGKTFYFVVNRSGRQSFKGAPQDIYSIQWDGTKLQALTRGNQRPQGLKIGPEGKYLFFLKPGGRLARVQVKGGKLSSIPFAARMVIEHPKERLQIFNEAWRILYKGFYDPEFHGKDWVALGNKYRPWALKASTQRDFRDVFNMMLGELNASHLGFFGPDRTETQEEQTGLLGIEVIPVEGGVKITHVVPRSPADRTFSKLYVGEVITHVDGVPVRSNESFYALLADKVDQKVILGVQDQQGKTREVIIRPTGSLRSALYEEWVQDRKRLTEEYSKGQLGYIHIQGMNWPSFERFERELIASGQGKKGIVIDVRFNGGGWTTDYLLTVLNVRQHAYTIPRGAARDLEKEKGKFREHYPYGERLPLAAWPRPSVALCNENSFSNAEIFSHAYKTLNLGTLVGVPTFGAVISTGGERLLDGSFVRLPFRGWFVKATDQNMENGPAVPDVIVENPPDYRGKDVDPQLQRAVDVLLEELKHKQER